MEERAFTVREAVQLSGIRYPRLDRWIRKDKLFGEELAMGKGPGKPRALSWADVVFLRCLARLLSAGVSYRSIRLTVAEARRTFGLSDRSPVALVAIEGRVCVARTEDEIIDFLRGGQLVLAAAFKDDAVAELSQWREANERDSAMLTQPIRLNDRTATRPS